MKIEQEKLLQLLMEECAEVSEAVSALAIRASKGIRFQMDEIQKGQELTNEQRILCAYFKVIDEVHDLIAMMEMVFDDNGHFGYATSLSREQIEEKKVRVLEWEEYARGLKVKP